MFMLPFGLAGGFGSVGCLSVTELITIDLAIVYCEIKISELELFLLGLKLLLII